MTKHEKNVAPLTKHEKIVAPPLTGGEKKY